jgi:hypothetical protein
MAEPGWQKGAVFAATFIVVGVILRLIEFKGAPKHIKYVDP